MNEELNRKLPFSLIAEQSLLGSILIDPASINEVADLIKADDFYIAEHKQIYLAATELFMTNREIDVVTLIDALVQKGVYNKSGGEDYIRTLSEVVPTALNVKDYARIVKEKSALRQLIAVCGEINESAFSEQESASGIIELAESKIFAIAQGRDTKTSDTYARFSERFIITFTSFRPIPTRLTEHPRAFRDLTAFSSVWVTPTSFSSVPVQVWVRPRSHSISRPTLQ